MGTIPSAAGNVIARQFEHAEWEGLRFYDLIFPLFIFVTGVAIMFSLTRLVEQESKSTAHWRVLRRSLLLFALGPPRRPAEVAWGSPRPARPCHPLEEVESPKRWPAHLTALTSSR